MPCNAPVPAANINDVDFSDNCSAVTIAHVGDSNEDQGCTLVVTRTYSATDACGNVSTCDQTITIPTDLVDPIISCPADVTLPCNSPPPPVDLSSVTATNGCSGLVISHVGDTPGGDLLYCRYYQNIYGNRCLW